MFLSKLGKKNQQFPPTPTISWWKQLHLWAQQWVLVPKNAVPISSVGQVLPAVQLILVQQLSFQVRNTQLMVTKLIWVFLHPPLWQRWSIIGLPPFSSFCALLVPTTNIFPPQVNYLTSQTLEVITLAPQGLLTSVTYTGYFEQLELLKNLEILPTYFFLSHSWERGNMGEGFLPFPYYQLISPSQHVSAVRQQPPQWQD